MFDPTDYLRHHGLGGGTIWRDRWLGSGEHLGGCCSGFGCTFFSASEGSSANSQLMVS